MDAPTPTAVHIRKRLTIVAVITVVLLQGCSTYQVRVADGKPKVKEYKTEVMHAYFWAHYMTPESVSAETCTRGMYDVIVKPNYLYDLASVFTLGLWMPREVGFQCKAPPVQSGGTLDP